MENKFDTSAFIAGYMEAYGQEPSYAVVVDAAVEQLKDENLELKNEIMFSKESLKYSDSDLDQILLSAKHSYQKHNMSTRGQAITGADDIYYHVIGAAKAKQQSEIQRLKSKLEIAKKGLEFYSLSCREEYGQLYNMAPSAEDKSVLVYAQVAIGSTARQALKEINEG